MPHLEAFLSDLATWVVKLFVSNAVAVLADEFRAVFVAR